MTRFSPSSLAMAPGILVKDLGLTYVCVASVGYLAFLWLVAELVKIKDCPGTFKVFFASIARLPLLIIGMVGEALVRVRLARN